MNMEHPTKLNSNLRNGVLDYLICFICYVTKLDMDVKEVYVNFLYKVMNYTKEVRIQTYLGSLLT